MFAVDALVDTPGAPDSADDPTVQRADDVTEDAVAAYVWDHYGLGSDVSQLFARWFLDSVADRLDGVDEDETITWRVLLESAMGEWRGTPPPRPGGDDALVARLAVLLSHGVLYAGQALPTIGDPPPRLETPDGVVVPTPRQWATVCDRVGDLVAQADGPPDAPLAGTS